MEKIRKAVGIFRSDIGYLMITKDNHFLEKEIKNVKYGYKREIKRKANKILDSKQIVAMRDLGIVQKKTDNIDVLIHIYEIELKDKVKIDGYKWLHYTEFNDLITQHVIDDPELLSIYIKFLSE